MQNKVGAKARVWRALIIRSMMERYGHEGFGFLWLILEPLLLVGGVAAIWTLASGPTKHGLNVIPFVITGYCMLTLWRHIVGRSAKILQNTSDLIYHRRVSYWDALLSFYFLEVFIVFVSFFVAYGITQVFNLGDAIDDYLVLFGAWLLMGFFCFGVGMLIASITQFSETAEHFIQPVMYISMPISGAFVMVSWLPHNVQYFYTLVPMVNAVEMFRAGYFGDGVPTTWDAGYLALCGLVTNVLGALSLKKAITRVEA